jgi:hypothetical protein
MKEKINHSFAIISMSILLGTAVSVFAADDKASVRPTREGSIEQAGAAARQGGPQGTNGLGRAQGKNGHGGAQGKNGFGKAQGKNGHGGAKGKNGHGGAKGKNGHGGAKG